VGNLDFTPRSAEWVLSTLRTKPRPGSQAVACRLCGEPAQHVFDHRVLSRYEVAYFECSGCGSLQTDPPYWLDEAYAIEGVHIDTGQAARILQMWLRLCLMLDRVGFDRSLPCVDYGGSSGLLARLMRDVGYDYRVYDRYDSGKYANYFRIDSLDGLHPGLVSAFEVFEHLPEPRRALGDILALQPSLIVFSTQFWEGQGKDWWYLVPCCGQHVFFYTERAMAGFASRHGYDLRSCLGVYVLTRRGSPVSEALDAAEPFALDAAVAGRMIVELGAGTPFTERDHAYALARFERELRMRPADQAPRLLGFVLRIRNMIKAVRS
jgi:hypothetical protein